MLIDELPDRCQFVTAKPTVRRQRHGIEPILRVTASMGYMDVWRFLILETVEKEPVATYPQQGWHTKSLLLLDVHGLSALRAGIRFRCRMNAATHLRLWNRRGGARVQAIEPRANLLGPSSLRVGVHVAIEALNQLSRQRRSFFIR